MLKKSIVNNRMVNKEKKENKKIIRQLKKLKNGESINIKDYEVLSLEDDFYLMIHQTNGSIFDKHFIEIIRWLNGECELD